MKKISMLLGLGVFLCTFACKSENKEMKEEATNFTVTSPIKKDTTVIKQYVCQIKSIQNIEIRALEKGYLKGIYVDEGKFVKQGQMMFQIMPNIYEAELMKNEAEVKGAEIEVLNVKTLAEKNVVSKNELLMAEAKLEKAKAERQLAKVHLGFTQITAPFSGIMDRLKVRKGSLVDEGDLLTTLSDNSKMWVYFNVPEAEYLNYKTKTSKDKMLSVNLLMANNELFKHAGVVETIEGEFDNETGNIAFRATFPNPEGLLRHGETGNIQVTVPLKNAILIPQKATFEVLDKIYVYVIDKENKVRSRAITIAAEMPHLYAVASGLSTGDKILLEGLRKVKENEKIEFKFENPSEVITHLGLYAE
ncbi:efflux RND transporter periplasmic adaptor subunit [Lacihabitans sp. LS3-19]|uniref:efflux RND transporter periplasmic adaptor subunit n=1 Tax=Lacihabitans sp. LS3-19 TaxID=2487335 RepID=UPI0020CE08F2|nr:efflux RND transporter periplasmic adaptor subunit [Lacihabitans sp. LS3-19]MCP9768595.1 efflux RND transporter periplasmic adaptor subunit [Lacihabitans sp. LS3-19]